ncbi:hypothetical protein NE237_029858 [Protea cynaroides]|uniref:Late embryogenesis abundant protein n=1 Tax=Protea cynaroides TaxID=273540 RepID=A0A9Q0JV79_9MAGN|nr:hypothetical protein NE237_029858 [Protea cynaroides]
MQAIKEKLQDMSAMRQAKAEAKAEEKEEKEIAKARLDVASEIRKAREAEAEMDLHVKKAAQKVEKEMAKHPELGADDHLPVSAGGDPNLLGTRDSSTNINTNINTTGTTPYPNLL